MERQLCWGVMLIVLIADIFYFIPKEPRVFWGYFSMPVGLGVMIGAINVYMEISGRNHLSFSTWLTTMAVLAVVGMFLGTIAAGIQIKSDSDELSANAAHKRRAEERGWEYSGNKPYEEGTPSWEDDFVQNSVDFRD